MIDFFIPLVSGIAIGIGISGMSSHKRVVTAEQLSVLTEAAYYSVLHPQWSQIHANGQTYAILPEDAAELGITDGTEMDVRVLAYLLLDLNDKHFNEEDWA